MTIQKLSLFLVFVCCTMIKTRAQQITVVGTAFDAKPSAIVISKTQGMYYLEGLHSWDKKYYGKKVRVTGIFAIDSSIMVRNDTPRQKNKDGIPLPPRQGTDGPIRVLKKAKWSLVK